MRPQHDYAAGPEATRNAMPPNLGYPASDSTPRTSKFFDATINVPTILTMVGMIVTVVVFGFGIYTSFDKRLTTLEQNDKEQESHFLRIEQANAEFRTDIRQTMGNIQSTVGQIRDWMISDGRVSNRAEARQWTKP